SALEHDMNALRQAANDRLLTQETEWTENGVTYRLQKDHTPALYLSQQERILKVPDSIRDPALLAPYYLNWLVGSEFHPYNSVFPTSLQRQRQRQIRYEQYQAVLAALDFLNSSHRRLIIVAPPGFGKTLVARKVLERISPSHAQFKALVIADRII